MAITGVNNGDQVVREFEAGSQIIRASVSHFRGEAYVDLRVWYEPEPGQELRPTKKGIRVAADYLDDLREAVDALTAAVASTPKQAARRRAALSSCLAIRTGVLDWTNAAGVRAMPGARGRAGADHSDCGSRRRLHRAEHGCQPAKRRRQ
jgi:hypothetical protein